MLKKLNDTQAKCDHLAGYIGRENDPLVKLTNASKLDEINQHAEAIAQKGFSVTVFPFCPVCGIKLLTGYYKAAEPVNGRIVK